MLWLESGTELLVTIVLGIVGVAALILSIINFYFEQLKGSEIRAFAWQLSHNQKVDGKGTTVGCFAFTNEGNRTGIVKAVFLRFSTGEKYLMQITVGVGQKGFPIPLPPQQTEFCILYADYCMLITSLSELLLWFWNARSSGINARLDQQNLLSSAWRTQGDTIVWTKLIVGNASEKLKEIDSGSANLAITSPPYYRLRDYDVEKPLRMQNIAEEYVKKLVYQRHCIDDS